MRPWEIVLSIGNLLAIVAILIPWTRTRRPLSYAVLAPSLLAVFQLLIEGPRWEMFPAYAITLLFASIGIVRLARLHVLQPRGLLLGLTFFLGGCWVSVSVCLPIALPVFVLPTPTGDYGIGTLTYHWTDTNRHEIFDTDPGAHRQIMAQFWYPTTRDSPGKLAPYVENGKKMLPAIAHLLRIPPFAFAQFSLVRTHAVIATQVSSREKRYPVVVFLTGVMGFRQSNTVQIEDLVSHGFIVVGIDQPYATVLVVLPGGRQISGWTRDELQPLINQSIVPDSKAPELNGAEMGQGIIPYLSEDVTFTLNQIKSLNDSDPRGILTGRLDLQDVGVMGVSLGAMVAAEAAHKDPRIRASLMMDAAMPADVVKAGLSCPAMWLTRDAATMRLEHRVFIGWDEAEIKKTLVSMRAVFTKAYVGDSYYIQIPGMFHLNFTDASLWSPLITLANAVGSIDSRQASQIVDSYTVAFFYKYLKSRTIQLLEGPSKRFPDVRFEKSNSFRDPGNR